MAAADALIQPIYGCKHREYIDLLDSNGALIAPSSPDTELIKDGAAPADATNELTQISSGHCYIDFTYGEMAYAAVKVIPKSTGALTQPFTLYPRRMPVLRSGTAQAGAAGSITLDASASDKDGAYVGCYVRASNDTPAGIQGEVRLITGYTGSTKVAIVAPNWDNTPTGSTTFEVLLSGELSIVSLLTTLAKLQSSLGIPKNQAFSNLPFPMLGTDTNEPKTGLSLTVQRVLDDGSLGAFAGTSNEIGSSGIYRINPAAADLNGKVCSFVVTASGAKTRVVTIITAD